jgi:type VI secretion system protein ImpH
MATESRRTDPPLAQEVFDEPYRFEFFQAVRLLERMYPERSSVGRNSEAQREVVRFRTRQTLSFPPCEIYDLQLDSVDAQRPPEMMVAFMGITGPVGILPYQYMELVMDRARYKDTALWAFLDLFNHRMISLFYRVWEKYHFPIAYERDKADPFTSYLFALIGLGTNGLRGRFAFRDQCLIPYGGLIIQRPHSASAMAAAIADYFEVHSKVVQFPGEWLNLDDNVTELGVRNSLLGTSTIAGKRVWSDQSKFRVKLGPMNFKKFQSFVPIGSAHRPLSQFARFFTGLEFEFDIQLVLDAKEVPFAVLTGTDGGPRLGWTSWLKTKEFLHDDEQVVIRASN